MYSHSVSPSNSVVTCCKPKVVSFLRVQISDGFRRTRTLCFVIPSSQHSVYLICKMCTKHPRPTRASIIFSSHLGLISKRPPRLAMHPFRRFVKACIALATRCWEIAESPAEPQTLLQAVDTLDLQAHQPLQLSPDEEIHVMSRLFGGQASDLRYRRQTWSRYSADCCLIARQPAGTGEALADRQWYDRDLSCSAFGFFFRRKCSREQSRACKCYSLKCDKGMTNHIFSFDEIWTRKNLTTFGLHPVTTLFEKGSECEYIHSKGNCPFFQMPYLAKSYDASVVSYLTWNLGVTFFNHPVDIQL